MTELERHVRKHVSTNVFMVHNHIEVESVEPDHAVFRLKMCPESTNSYGMLHGGAAYTLADMATGIAAYTDGRSYVTQNGSLHFVAAQMKGIVRADARVRHRGRSVVVVSVDILGEERKLLATGEFAFFCIDNKR